MARLAHPAFHVESSDIALLNGDELTRLLHADGEHWRVPSEFIHTSLRTTDPDGGIDARIVEGPPYESWLGAGESAWQFKAGSMPSPVQLTTEVEKPGVVEAVQRGAAYVAVVEADPKPLTRQRRLSLRENEVGKIRSGAQVRLLCGSDVARWVNEHPAILAEEFGRPMAGVTTAELWLRAQPEHAVPFQLDEQRRGGMQAMDELRTGCETEFIHIRIEGKLGANQCTREYCICPRYQSSLRSYSVRSRFGVSSTSTASGRRPGPRRNRPLGSRAVSSWSRSNSRSVIHPAVRSCSSKYAAISATVRSCTNRPRSLRRGLRCMSARARAPLIVVVTITGAREGMSMVLNKPS